MPFRITGLSPDLFRPLFDLSDDDLAARNITRRVADSNPGFPCRVSLEDASVGEELLLLPFDHHTATSPYRGSGPIFVRRAATRAHETTNDIPQVLRHRLLSLRAYTQAGMMSAADVCDGGAATLTLHRMFEDSEVAYVHIHNAKPGCFSCAATRIRDAVDPSGLSLS